MAKKKPRKPQTLPKPPPLPRASQLAPRNSLRHKYNAQRVTLDGRQFDSKAEAAYYSELLVRKKAGQIITFLWQVPFHLPGGVRYVVDFLEFHADGTVHFIDVKGVETAEFKLKKKQVEELYAPIKIEVVKR